MRTRIEKLGDRLHQELERIRDYCSSAENQRALMIACEAALDAGVRISPAITRLGLGEILYLLRSAEGGDVHGNGPGLC